MPRLVALFDLCPIERATKLGTMRTRTLRLVATALLTTFAIQLTIGQSTALAASSRTEIAPSTSGKLFSSRKYFITNKKASSSSTKATTTVAKPISTGPTVKAKVESKLLELQKTASPKLSVHDPKCPNSLALSQSSQTVAALAGKQFRCTIVIEDASAPYDVKFANKSTGSQASFLITHASAIIDISILVASASAQVGSPNAKVTCGEHKVVIANKGQKLTCKVAYKSGPPQEITYKVVDLDGNLVFDNIS